MPGEQLGGKRRRRLPDLRDLDLELVLAGLHLASAKPVPQPLPVVAQPALVLRPALIPRPTQPGVELVPHSPLNDQPGAQLGQLRQRLPRILTHPNSQQPVDPLLNLRRRRYGTSHGVGPLQLV
jgi:hypothetical protein